MSLIRSFIPEDDYGRPMPLARSFARTAVRSDKDALPFGIMRPRPPRLPVAMALECIRPTLTFNTGQRFIGVPWAKFGGELHFLVMIEGRAIYLPLRCLCPLAKRHDHLFPHWKRRPERRAA